MQVSIAPFESEAEAKLELRAKAANRLASNLTSGHEVLCWIATPGPPLGGQLLPSVSLRIEDQRMQIHLPAPFIAHDDASGRPRLRIFIRDEAVAFERLADGGEVSSANS